MKKTGDGMVINSYKEGNGSGNGSKIFACRGFDVEGDGNETCRPYARCA